MTPEIQLQIIALLIAAAYVGLQIVQAFTGRTVASTAVIASDAKQANAVTELALMNYEERKALSESVSVVRDKLSNLQGQYDNEQRHAAKKIDALESQMKELGTTSDARIQSLDTEIKGLNNTIKARDETIAELKSQVRTLSETVAKFLAAQTGKQSPATPPAAPVPTGGAIPMELTATGTITAIPSDKPPSDTKT